MAQFHAPAWQNSLKTWIEYHSAMSWDEAPLFVMTAEIHTAMEHVHRHMLNSRTDPSLNHPKGHRPQGSHQTLDRARP